MPPLTIDGLAHPTVTRQIRELVTGHERTLTRLRQLSDQLDAQSSLTLPQIQQALSVGGSNTIAFIGSPGSIDPATLAALTNLLAAAKVAYFKDLGGSWQIGAPLFAAVQLAGEAKSGVVIDWVSVAAMGWNLRAHVTVRANGATTVKPSIYNVTDATTDNGVICAATNIDRSGANQQQIINITKPASLGLKTYQLRVLASDALKSVFALCDYVETY